MASSFDYSLNYKNLDLRRHPELYRTGKGEQGVLLVEPYKSEILPHWKFKTPDFAKESAEKIYALFEEYRELQDFVGMDKARKFLQMGYTRSRRYANHKSGKNTTVRCRLNRKGGAGHMDGTNYPSVRPRESSIGHHLYEAWQKAKGDPVYRQLLQAHKEQHQ